MGSTFLPPFFFLLGALASIDSRSGNYSLVLTTAPFGINSLTLSDSILNPAAWKEFPLDSSFFFSPYDSAFGVNPTCCPGMLTCAPGPMFICY
jgi:hypothetical protein